MSALPGLGLGLSRLLEPWLPTPVPQLAAFAAWALPFAALSVLLLVAGRAWWRAGAAAVVLAVLLAWAAPPWGAEGRAGDPSAEGRPLTVLTLNAEFGRADPQVLMDLARDRAADVVVVEELTPAMATAIDAAGAATDFPHRDLHPAGSASGTGIWSRFPVTPRGLLESHAFAMPVASVDLPGGRTLTVIGVHTVAPVPGAVTWWRDDLASVRDAVSALPEGPAVVTGDFNASRDHSGFREILAAGVVDAGDVRSAAPWPGFTWPADRPGPAATRLDHVLVTPRYVKVTKLQVVTVPGTDHHGVVASLVVPD